MPTMGHLDQSLSASSNCTLMDIPRNTFRESLRAGQTRIGLWVGLAHANAAELLATCGFDWLLLDGEHAPNDVRIVLDQLRAVAPYPVHPIVRPVHGETALIKQYLDIGAQTLLVPMINTPLQAAEVVRAMRYAPEGIRGMGAALARASRWNQVDDYLNRANDEMCLLVQAETTEAIENLREISEVDGVDGVFFGPADLSASMGYRGQPNHPEVQRTILEGIRTVRSTGRAAGVLMANQQIAQIYLDAGAQFVAVGVDTTLLVQAASALAKHYKGTNANPLDPSNAAISAY
jgi:4-hydroxy-2-oxoheptanedioate aldolase